MWHKDLHDLALLPVGLTALTASTSGLQPRRAQSSCPHQRGPRATPLLCLWPSYLSSFCLECPSPTSRPAQSLSPQFFSGLLWEGTLQVARTLDLSTLCSPNPGHSSLCPSAWGHCLRLVHFPH